jgi:GNAT superfamily N-acetyltransferase
MMLNLPRIDIVWPSAAYEHAREPGPLPEPYGIPMTTTRGCSVRVRAVGPSDTLLLAELLARLSDQTVRRRFFQPLTSAAAIEREAQRVAHGDPLRQVALVALADEPGTPRAVALAELSADPGAPTVAEVALLVRDDYQRAGVGSLLTRLLVRVAWQRGIRTVRANALAENTAVLAFIRSLGVAYTTDIHRGELTLLVQLPAR